MGNKIKCKKILMNGLNSQCLFKGFIHTTCTINRTTKKHPDANHVLYYQIFSKNLKPTSHLTNKSM